MNKEVVQGKLWLAWFSISIVANQVIRSAALKDREEGWLSLESRKALQEADIGIQRKMLTTFIKAGSIR